MSFIKRSKFHSLSFDDTSRGFHLEFDVKTVKLTFCQLLALRQKIYSVEIESLFYEETCPHDFKILTLCGNQHLFLLTIEQILDLRQLLGQAFVTMGVSQPFATI